MARRGAEAASLYARGSGRYPSTGVGDVNTYALFAETLSQLASPNGRAGFIVPTGIVTDDSTKAYFAHVSQNRRLASVYDFENREGTFPAIDSRTKFSLMTLGAAQATEFVCFATQVPQLLDSRRRFTLTPDEFRLINPNTRTCPVFRSQRDAELTKKLYRNAPVLLADAPLGNGSNPNPWGISFQRMLDMSTDSGLFQDDPSAPEIPLRLPLYEGKMIHQFDHRWATYVDAPDKPDGLDTKDVSEAQKADPAFTVRPRYWVEETEVLARIARVPSRVAKAWLAWRKTDAAARDAQEASAVTSETTRATSDSCDALTLALAKWVAGALFLRVVVQQGSEATSAPQPHAQTANLFGDVPPDSAPATATASPATQPWSDKAAVAATQLAERQLAAHYSDLWEALKASNTTGKKALPAFTKWALQDDPAQGLGLNDNEMDEIKALTLPHQPGRVATNSVASPANSTRSIRQFDIDFTWMNTWMEKRSPRWLMGWRRNARSTDERTTIATVMPRSGQGDSVFLWNTLPNITPALNAALLASLSSIPFDYVARQKVGGINFSFYFMKQLPVFSPGRYTEANLAYIVPRVLELTHTAHDMQPWANDLAVYDPRHADQRQTPFPWNPDRRATLRAELDAYYARLYGLTRDELRYILDPADVMGADYPSETFRVLKNGEMKAYGEYRTQRLVLAAWDALAAADVSPPGPADISLPIYSEQGVISNPQEGDFAGLIVALIQNSGNGVSIVELEDAVAHSSLANTYLELADAARLFSLMPTMPLLAGNAALTSVSPIIQRLESVGAVSRMHMGGNSRFFGGAIAVPSDVLTRPEHTEMAKLMLKLETNRALSRGNQDDESLPGRQVRGTS